jgi:hypothetical protein
VKERRADARRQHRQRQAAEARRVAQRRRAQARQQHAGPRHPAAAARLVGPVTEDRLEKRRRQELQADQRSPHAERHPGLRQQHGQQGRQDICVAVVDGVRQRHSGGAEYGR